MPNWTATLSAIAAQAQKADTFSDVTTWLKANGPLLDGRNHLMQETLMGKEVCRIEGVPEDAAYSRSSSV